MTSESKNKILMKAKKIFDCAKRFQKEHTYGSVEHFLLAGILLEGTGLASKALTAMHIDIEKIEKDMLLSVSQLPATQKHLEDFDYYENSSWQEAINLGNNFIGTEHVLLALCASSNGRAIFDQLNKPANLVKSMVLKLLGLPYKDSGEV